MHETSFKNNDELLKMFPVLVKGLTAMHIVVTISDLRLHEKLLKIHRCFEHIILFLIFINLNIVWCIFRIRVLVF